MIIPVHIDDVLRELNGVISEMKSAMEFISNLPDNKCIYRPGMEISETLCNKGCDEKGVEIVSVNVEKGDKPHIDVVEPSLLNVSTFNDARAQAKAALESLKYGHLAQAFMAAQSAQEILGKVAGRAQRDMEISVKNDPDKLRMVGQVVQALKDPDGERNAKGIAGSDSQLREAKEIAADISRVRPFLGHKPKGRGRPPKDK
jgi:hypothetical protein